MSPWQSIRLASKRCEDFSTQASVFCAYPYENSYFNFFLPPVASEWIHNLCGDVCEIETLLVKHSVDSLMIALLMKLLFHVRNLKAVST